MVVFVFTKTFKPMISEFLYGFAKFTTNKTKTNGSLINQ